MVSQQWFGGQHPLHNRLASDLTTGDLRILTSPRSLWLYSETQVTDALFLIIQHII
jgi:hypothetical protein